MKKFLLMLGLSLLISSCVTNSQRSNWRRFNLGYSRKPDLTNIKYLGGNGSSMEDAIKITNAGNSENGIASEYAYIEKHYGKRKVDWELIKQIFDKKNGKMYDILQIQIILDNQKKVIYFDITDFYGR
ncbi:MAG: hypothetical protein HQ554_03980 [FCB group bacterium]|nr:hypothetical protein [FCB group bacterium]